MLANSGFLWTQEVAQFALSIITFIGGARAFRVGQHGFVRFVLDRLAERTRRWFETGADLLVLLAAAVAAVASLPVIAASWGELTPILSLPAALLDLPLTAGMVLIALYALDRLARRDPRLVAAVALPLAAAVTIAVATSGVWQPWLAGDGAMYLGIVLLLALLLAGLPVAFGLILATALYLETSGGPPLLAMPQNMVNGTSNFVLLAVPFFIFAGLIMERGGISLRLVRFVHALVGHFRGGLLQVMVGSMYLVSGLSGSKAADVAAVGSVMREMLEREGISPETGAAVLAASAAMGETVPPSIAILVLGSITSLSIAALFIGGLIPAAVIAVCLMALIFVQARREPGAHAQFAGGRVLLRAALGAILPLGMPVMLFAGILLGVATPTEVSAFAVLYGLGLAIVGYREMTGRDFLRAVIDTATLTGMILLILAAASGFSWALTVAGLPQRLVVLLNELQNNAAVFLVGSIVLLVVVGSLLEGLPALNVLAPLLLPIAGQIGLSRLHYGIVLVIAMGIGAFMPPTGVGFYVCCAVMRTSVEATSRAMLPYLAVLLGGLLVVAFVPWLTLSLPHAFGFPG